MKYDPGYPCFSPRSEAAPLPWENSIALQAGLLTSGSPSDCPFPWILHPQWVMQSLSPVTAAGPSLNSTGFPIMPLRHPNLSFIQDRDKIVKEKTIGAI